MLTKLIYKFNATSIKISVDFLVEIDKQIPDFIWNAKNLAKST